MRPKVIVLILSFNGKHLLEDCIRSYAANDYDNFGLVVIDNGSTDGTREYVASGFPAVKVLRTDINLKYSGGFNLGLEYAFKQESADFVLITNNDVKADKGLIRALVDAAEANEKAGFVIGKVYFHSQPDTLQTVGKKFDPVMWNGGHIGNRERDAGQYDRDEERDWCDDIYWLVKKEVWNRTGGYDTEFAFQGEDFDWQVRAKKLGYKIIYAHRAMLWHKESMTIGRTSAFKAYYDARNPIIVHLKYRSADEFRRFFRIRLRSLLRSSIRQLVRLELRHAWANCSGLCSALRWGIRHKKLSFRHVF